MFDFDPQASNYSRRNAFFLGEAAAVAYESPESCEKWARSRGLDETFNFFSSDAATRRCDTQGFIAQNPEVVLVAFRGTQPKVPLDWLSDFQALHVNWGLPTGKVHKGFYQALQGIWNAPLNGRKLLPDRLLNRGDRSVWVTGHSLGGALAELCAAEAALVSGVQVQGVYTFGQPRVGDQAFADALQAAIGGRIFRLVNDRDIVPRVPLFGMGFRHYGCEIFFDDAGTADERPGCVENLMSALRLAKLALGSDALRNAAQVLGHTIADRSHGSDQAAGAGEQALLEAYKRLLAAGTENITDHDMRKYYLARLSPDKASTQRA